MTARAAAFGALLAAGCTTNGTLSVSLVESPGSTLLDGVETLELTLTDPSQTVTVERQGSGFSIAFSVDATSVTGQLIARGMDGSGNVIAVGESPPFSVAAITAAIALFMAPPNSVTAAPIALAPPVDQLAAAPIAYGALFAGGRDAGGAPTSGVSIYNSYSHTFEAGSDLPAPRYGLALGAFDGEYALMFGGTGSGGAPADNDWYFDATVSPNGAYSDFGDKTGFARSGALLVQADSSDFLLTGSPVATLSDVSATIAMRTDIASLPDAGAALIGSDSNYAAIFAGGSGIVRYRAATDAFDVLSAPGLARDGATVAELPGALVGVFCGSADGALVDPVSGAVTSIPGVPAEPRASGCAVAATSRFVVIAGGTLGSGGVATTAEIYDASTFAPVATAPLVVPRTGATAVALPNGQVLIVGGDDGSGAPIAAIELFTPSP